MKKYTISIFSTLFFLFTVLPTITPQKAAAASTYADGEYSIPFSVLKDTGNELSATAEYVVSPAKLVVQNGKPHIIMTLNNSSWWQYFKVQSGGGFADVQVLSEDSANDKRIVKFSVTDVEQLVNAKIHVVVTGIPGFTYDNKYDIRFKFSSSGIPAAPAVEKAATPPVTKPVSKPATQPSLPPKTTAPATQKPVEVKEEKKDGTASNLKKSENETVEKDVSSSEDSADGNSNDIEAEQIDEEIEVNETDAKETESTELDETSKEEDEVSEASTEQLVEETASTTEDNSKTTTIWTIGILLLVVIGGLIFIMNRKKVQNKQ
ncbi:NEAT domain-containing protein [Sporosarcina sp. FA9]|uniref:NEAT domain-containing protein n=1 Tax=Sporosarcina sp. FA9 TaxID=3413030 RepID=UPI003F659B55